MRSTQVEEIEIEKDLKLQSPLGDEKKWALWVSKQREDRNMSDVGFY